MDKRKFRSLVFIMVSVFIAVFLLPNVITTASGAGEDDGYSSVAISSTKSHAFYSPVIAMKDNDGLSLEMEFVDFNYSNCSWMGFGVCSGYNNVNPFIHTLPDGTLIAYDMYKYLGDLGTAGSVVQFDRQIGFNVLLVGYIRIRAEFIYHGVNSEYSLSVKRPEDADFNEIQHATGIKMPENSAIGCVFYGADFRVNRFKINSYYNGAEKYIHVTSQDGEEGGVLYNHTVSYVTGNGEYIPDSVVHHGKKVGQINENQTSGKTENYYFTAPSDSKYLATAAPEDPVREGYDFCGWYLEENYVTPFDLTADTVKDNLVLYAKWEESLTVEVSFVTNGGEPLDPINVIKNGTMEEIVPERTGYVFAGWYKDIELEQPLLSTETLDRNITLYAKWDGDYTVRFVIDGITVRLISLNEGESYSDYPALPEKEGYTKGWSVQTIENVSEDTVVESVYEIIKLTVTFNGENGEQVASVTVDYGNDLDPSDFPEVPEKVGFDGRWDKETIRNLKEDLTVTAVYEPRKIAVTFRAAGFDDIIRYVAYSGKLTKIPPCPYVEGKFGRWEDFENDSIIDPFTVNAVYQTAKCTVTFYNGNGETVKSITVDYGEGINAAEIPSAEEKAGYNLIGWSVEDFAAVKGDLSVYPVYGKITITVSYKVDSLLYQTVSYEFGGEPVLPENPYKTGHEFVAWVDEDGNEVDYRSLAEDITLNAGFRKKQFVVRFLVDGQVVKVETVKYGESATAPILPEEEMKKYSGWDSGFNAVYRDTEVNMVKITENSFGMEMFAVIGGILLCAALTVAVILFIRKGRKNV